MTLKDLAIAETMTVLASHMTVEQREEAAKDLCEKGDWFSVGVAQALRDLNGDTAEPSPEELGQISFLEQVALTDDGDLGGAESDG